jgi:hypothetical protein
MPKFLFVYHGGSHEEAPEEMEKLLAQWGAWFETMGAGVVDSGNPVQPSKTVFKTSVTDDGGANPASGYGLFTAANMDAAIAMAKGCPILDAGGNVEVAEIIEL